MANRTSNQEPSEEPAIYNTPPIHPTGSNLGDADPAMERRFPARVIVSSPLSHP